MDGLVRDTLAERTGRDRPGDAATRAGAGRADCRVALGSPRRGSRRGQFRGRVHADRLSRGTLPALLADPMPRHADRRAVVARRPRRRLRARSPLGVPARLGALARPGWRRLATERARDPLITSLAGDRVAVSRRRIW